jgi:hypothetical protein
LDRKCQLPPDLRDTHLRATKHAALATSEPLNSLDVTAAVRGGSQKPPKGSSAYQSHFTFGHHLSRGCGGNGKFSEAWVKGGL